jgi:hypothetical protein
MRIGAAILLFLVAGALGVAELLAFIDPAGTQLADDADPFGIPHASWSQHAVFILLAVACVAIGARLLRQHDAH